MGYEDEIEHQRHKQKVQFVKDILSKVDESISSMIRQQEELAEKKTQFKRKGISSGLDEALHEISKGIALEILRSDESIGEKLKRHIKKQFIDWIDNKSESP